MVPDQQTQLEIYVRKWSLRQPLQIAESATSRVYKVIDEDRPAVLKLLTPIGIEDESSGALALGHFGGEGAVRLYQAEQDAHLLEYADGINLAEFRRINGDEAALGHLISTIRQLHARSGRGDGYRTLRQRFKCLFEPNQLAAADAQANRAVAIARDLMASEENRGVLHGDLHHENILSTPRGWLAIDPKGLFGERVFDVANVFYNPRTVDIASKKRVLYLADRFHSELGFNRERILQYALIYGHLSATWMREVQLDTRSILEVASILGELV